MRNDAHVEIAQKGRVGLAESDRDGERVGGLDALDGLVERAERGSERGVENRFQGIPHVLRGERPSIVKPYAPPQMEDPVGLVRALPALGEAGRRLQIAVEPHEAVVQEIDDAVARRIPHEAGIERARVHVGPDADAIFNGLRAGGHRREEADGRPESRSRFGSFSHLEQGRMINPKRSFEWRRLLVFLSEILQPGLREVLGRHAGMKLDAGVEVQEEGLGDGRDLWSRRLRRPRALLRVSRRAP